MKKSQRLLRLVREIDVRPGQTGQQLAERFKCTTRTILRDIEDLQSKMGLVVVSQGGYRCLNKPNLYPWGLTRDEVVALVLAESIALPHLDSEAAAALASALGKFRSSMPSQEKLAALEIEKNTAVIASAATEADIATTLLKDLAQATEKKLEIYFLYQGRKDSDHVRRHVEPVGVYLQEGRWYLYAFDLNRQDTRSFRLSRISGLEITANSFQPRIAFSAGQASFHQWDLSDNEPTTFKIEVSPGLARWFQENKPHPSVTVTDSTVTLSVKDPESFLCWFSSLDDAELMEPLKYRAWLNKRFSRLEKLYEK